MTIKVHSRPDASQAGQLRWGIRVDHPKLGFWAIDKYIGEPFIRIVRLGATTRANRTWLL